MATDSRRDEAREHWKRFYREFRLRKKILPTKAADPADSALVYAWMRCKRQSHGGLRLVTKWVHHTFRALVGSVRRMLSGK